MAVWRKQTVRWTLNGKRTKANTQGAIRQVKRSKRFYGTLRDAEGNRKQIPLCEDRTASEAMLRRLQAEADRDRAAGVPRYVRQSKRNVFDCLDEYEAYLRGKGSSERHITQTIRFITKLLNATHTKTLGELNAQRITQALAVWRQPKQPLNGKRPLANTPQQTPVGIGIATSNHYLIACKAFSRWAFLERMLCEDPLSNLRRLNARTDRRRTRRALTQAELERLFRETANSNETLSGLTPTARAMLYRIATYTGLRASELASLTAWSFDLEAGTVTVAAAYSKRRRDDTLPLHASLIRLLSNWLPTKNAHAPLWQPTWNYRPMAKACQMLKRDLKRAGIPYSDHAKRVADFHALRHTFVTSLAKAGVHPLKAKELARHSTIMLTMDVYSHLERDELREALGALPDVG